MKQFFTYLFLFIFFVIVFVLLFPLGYFKDDILKQLNKNSHYQISIEEIDYRLLTLGSFELSGLTFSNEKKELLKLKRLEVEVDLYELYEKKLHIESAVVYGLEIQSSPEELKAEKKKISETKGPKEQKEKSGEIFIKELSFEKVGLVDFNADLGDLVVEDLTFLIENGELKDLKKVADSLELDVSLNFSKIKKDDYKIEKFRSKGRVANQFLNIESFEGLLFNEKFEGRLTQFLDFNEKEPKNELKVQLEKFDLKNLSEVEALKKYPIKGALKLGVEAKYNMLGQRDADITVESSGIQIKNIDIDKLINTYKDSQKVTAIDALGFYTLGPVGLLYSQGVNFGKSIPGTFGGKSSIKNLNIEVLIKDHILSMKDVAVRTEDNLVAVQGRINLENKKFDKMKIGFLDKKYCPELVQKIEGTLDKPEFDLGKSVLKTLAAPVTSLIDSSKELISGCKRFYKGKVKY